MTDEVRHRNAMRVVHEAERFVEECGGSEPDGYKTLVAYLDEGTRPFGDEIGERIIRRYCALLDALKIHRERERKTKNRKRDEQRRRALSSTPTCGTANSWRK